MKRIIYTLIITIMLTGCANYGYLSGSKPKITVTSGSSEDFIKRNPGALKYFKLVRNRIAEIVVPLYKKYSRNKDCGNIFISFKLMPDGELVYSSVNFIEGSSENRFLRKITLVALQRSAPFPKFAKSLKKELKDGMAFNTLTSFRDCRRLREFNSYIEENMGLFVQDVNDDLRDIYDISLPEAVVILDVIEGDSAYNAGLRAGDVITAVNEHKVKNVGEFIKTVERYPASLVIKTTGGSYTVKRYGIKTGINPKSFKSKF
ncbi:MAG: PDZ domain-containing protein [Candidatus Omnitrophota bacterium]